MGRKSDQIFQFKVTLKGIRPPIWRRILVPEDMTFDKFSETILDFMGWRGYHLHAFHLKDPRTGLEVEMTDMTSWEAYDVQGFALDEKKYKLNQVFSEKNNKIRFEYDFGDGWEHEIRFEKILPRDEEIKYPICTAGRRACPPENVGGIWAYKEFLEAIKDPDHPGHDEWLEWISVDFDPERVNAKITKIKTKKSKKKKKPESKDVDKTKSTRELAAGRPFLNPEVSLVMVTDYLPVLSNDFEDMRDAANDLARMIRPKSPRKIMEEIFLELLAFDFFILEVGTINLVVDYPIEHQFLHRASRIVFSNLIAGWNENLLDRLSDVNDRYLEFAAMADKQPNPNEAFNKVVSRLTEHIAGRKPSKNLKESIAGWAHSYAVFHSRLFENLELKIGHIFELFLAEAKTFEIIEEINKQAPISVSKTPELLKSLKKHGANPRHLKDLKIMDADYSGDAFGIMCRIAWKGGNHFYAPLAQLLIREDHPLKERIDKYLKQRAKEFKSKEKRK